MGKKQNKNYNNSDSKNESKVDVDVIDNQFVIEDAELTDDEIRQYSVIFLGNIILMSDDLELCKKSCDLKEETYIIDNYNEGAIVYRHGDANKNEENTGSTTGSPEDSNTSTDTPDTGVTEPETPEEEKEDPVNPYLNPDEMLYPGKKMVLHKAKLYKTKSSEFPLRVISGVYYLYIETSFDGRYKITEKQTSKVKDVIGYIDYMDLR